MRRNFIVRVLAVLLMAALLLCAGCSKKTPPTPSAAPGGDSGLSEPVNEDVQIETPYCTMTIPFAFTDLVAVEHTEGDNMDSYAFSVQLEDRSVPVYTIHFVKGSADQGELFGTLKTDDGDVQITFEANDPDESLQGEDLEAFYTAQETINDVFQSLQAVSGFTGA